MNNATWLRSATKKLEKAGVGTAHLDTLVLLEDTLGTDRAYLLAHPENELSTTQLQTLDDLIKRRAQHEPLAFVRGKTEFYGREFIVNKHVLEPRPESETMVELALKVIGDRLQFPDKSVNVVDIGTGSGAIGITVQLEMPETHVIGTDIDANCLKIARQNAKKHEAEINCLQGDLLEPLLPLKLQADIMLCNLPYVPDHYQINKAALMEPRIAIFGGSDGLEVYRKLFDQIDGLVYKPGFVLTESLPFQHADLAAIAKQHGYLQSEEDDFIQMFSYLKASQK